MNRLILLVESRIRGDVYVRFGGELPKTHRSNTAGRWMLSLPIKKSRKALSYYFVLIFIFIRRFVNIYRLMYVYLISYKLKVSLFNDLKKRINMRFIFVFCEF